MKATDLMIGDWIHYSGLGPIKVDLKVFLEADSFPNENKLWNCLPIDLTPELLEANGWQKEESCDSKFYRYKDPEVPFFIPISSKLKERMFTEGFFDSIFIRFDYVHEFQHALRLCGFDDLADNFKI